MNQISTYDISTDYLRYPTFSPLPASVRIRGDILRCSKCGGVSFIIRQSDGKPVCSTCGTEIISENNADVLHLSRPERPVFQSVDCGQLVYIL